MYYNNLMLNNDMLGLQIITDYHEQHAYAYDLFGFERKDNLEIGSLSKGHTKQAQEDYIKDISAVLNNSKKFLKKDYNVFLVANDKYNLYPKIAELTGMKIVNQFKRPVLNRTEKDKNAYAGIIFHLRKIQFLIQSIICFYNKKLIQKIF